MPQPRIPIMVQIECVRRELRMRESVYERWVEGGKMNRKKADAELAAMRAVLETLREIEAKSRLV